MLAGSARIEKGQRLLQPQLNDYAKRNGRANSFGRRATILEPSLATLRRARKGDWREGLLAAMIRKETIMRLDWISAEYEEPRNLPALPPNPENALPRPRLAKEPKQC
jgi:hypothetical protein